MMTGVIGFSEFLIRTFDQNDPRRSDVEEVIQAGTRAADVTRQLLAFTRQQFLQPQMVELNAVVLEMEKMLRRSLGEDKLLELRLLPDAGPDPGRPGAAGAGAHQSGAQRARRD